MQQQHQHTNYQRRQTPGKRRQSRNATNSPALKSYASENDVPNEAAAGTTFLKDFSADGPQTPSKSNSASPAPSSLHPNAQQPKARSKNRPKNVSTSPGPVKAGRRTPPQSAVVPKAAAYAGATFHASPAPASLPIPSFLAKAVPESPGPRVPNRPVSQEPSPPHTDSEMPTPVHKACIPKQTREESPLDIFFRADRAEKAKAGRASSANALVEASGPFSPPSLPRSPQESTVAASKESPLSQSRRPQFNRHPSGGFSSAELNKTTSGSSMGPAFSTPYQDRIRAAQKTSRSGGGPQASPSQPPTQHLAQDRSEALKNFLFAGQNSNPRVAGAAPGSAGTPRLGGAPINLGAAGATAVASAGSSGTPQAQQINATSQSRFNPVDRRSADLLTMEDNLRRILKLDEKLEPRMGMGSNPPSMANAHPATQSQFFAS